MAITDTLKGLKARFDDWRSLTTGFGGTLDRVKSLSFHWGTQLSDTTLEALFHKHALAARVVEHPVREAMREGFRIVVAETQPAAGAEDAPIAPEKDQKALPEKAAPPPRTDAFPPARDAGDEPKPGAPPFGAPPPPPPPKDPKLVKAQLAKKLARSAAQRAAVETSTAMAMAMRDLKVQERITEAKIWGRLFGGAALILGIEDGRPSQFPVNEQKIRALRYLHVVDRRCLSPNTYYRDPTHPSFGQPETYFLTPVAAGGTDGEGMRVVHETRVIRFGGQLTSEYKKAFAYGWDFSVLERIYEPLQRYDSIWLSVGAVMSDLSQGVLKIEDLWSKIAGDEYDLLKRRIELMEQSRSSARSMVIDVKEDYERKATPISGVDGVIDRSESDLAGHVGWPSTKLFMRSPAGMNATGESDEQTWDGILSGVQKELQPAVERVTQILFLAKEGPTQGQEPDEWDVKWNPTRKPTPAELGTIRKQQAETDKIHIDSKVLTAEAVRRGRWRPEGYQDELVIDPDEIEQVAADEEIARAEQFQSAADAEKQSGDDDAKKKAAEEEVAKQGDKALLLKMRDRAA